MCTCVGGGWGGDALYGSGLSASTFGLVLHLYAVVGAAVIDSRSVNAAFLVPTSPLTSLMVKHSSNCNDLCLQRQLYIFNVIVWRTCLPSGSFAASFAEVRAAEAARQDAERRAALERLREAERVLREERERDRRWREAAGAGQKVGGGLRVLCVQSGCSQTVLV